MAHSASGMVGQPDLHRQDGPGGGAGAAEAQPARDDRSVPAHAIAYRISLPFLGGRYYLAVFVGDEQRSNARLERDSQRKGWLHTLFSLAMVAGLVATILMGTLTAAYIAKCMLGIDIFDEPSFLHGMFFAS